MNRSILRAAACLALISALAACVDRDMPLAAPDAPSTGRTVYLGLSNLSPKAGEEIVVTVNSIAAAGDRIGSFKVRLGLSEAGLEFVASVPQSDGMIIANPVGDALVIVGASGDGFTTSALAKVRVKVLDPARIGSLALTVDGLTSTDFANEAPASSVERKLFRSIITK